MFRRPQPEKLLSPRPGPRGPLPECPGGSRHRHGAHVAPRLNHVHAPEDAKVSGQQRYRPSGLTHRRPRRVAAICCDADGGASVRARTIAARDLTQSLRSTLGSARSGESQTGAHALAACELASDRRNGRIALGGLTPCRSPNGSEQQRGSSKGVREQPQSGGSKCSEAR
jgi:hypothetical protein